MHPDYATEKSVTKRVGFDGGSETQKSFDGSLEKIRLYASSAGGNTVCKLYVNAVFADGATSTSDTVSVSATTTATFTFSSGNTYSAGDLIRVTVDPTNRLDDVNLTCIWKYNTNTL